jgi:hypothetical protein
MKHTVTFYSPGTFISETTIRPIKKIDVNKAVEMAQSIEDRYGAKPYAFSFTSTSFFGKKKISGKYYLKGKVRTLEELKLENNPENTILIQNMELMQADRIIETTTPWKWASLLYMLYNEDVVLEEIK